MEVEKVKAEIIEFRHPWAEFIIVHPYPAYHRVFVIDYPQGLPYGWISRDNKISLPVQDFVILLDAKLTKRGVEEVCIGNKGDVTYLYLVQRKRLFKFVNGEVEFEIKNVDDYNNALATLEEVNDIEEIKEKCQ